MHSINRKINNLSAKLRNLGTSGTNDKDAKYVYQPLDVGKKEIRLVKVEHGRGSFKPITCSLSTFSLNAPEYAALSYCWGDESDKAYVPLDRRRFPITRNLFSVLRQLRSDVKYASYMWIDAICINQDDEDEKSHQIPLMPQIYSRASSVPAWLGEEADDSELAFNVVRDLGAVRCVCQELEDELAIPGREFMDLHIFWDYIKLCLDVRSWIVVRMLFCRPYWRRMWVVQEVLLSRRTILCCGSRQLPFDAFMAFYEFLGVQVTHPVNNDLFMDEQKTQFRLCKVSNMNAFSAAMLRDGVISYPTLIMSTFDQLCKDPRDKLLPSADWRRLVWAPKALQSLRTTVKIPQLYTGIS